MLRKCMKLLRLLFVVPTQEILILSLPSLSWEIELFCCVGSIFSLRSRESSSLMVRNLELSPRIFAYHSAFRIARFAKLEPPVRRFCQSSYIRAERSARRGTDWDLRARRAARETVEYFECTMFPGCWSCAPRGAEKRFTMVDPTIVCKILATPNNTPLTFFN